MDPKQLTVARQVEAMAQEQAVKIRQTLQSRHAQHPKMGATPFLGGLDPLPMLQMMTRGMTEFIATRFGGTVEAFAGAERGLINDWVSNKFVEMLEECDHIILGRGVTDHPGGGTTRYGGAGETTPG